MAEAVSRTVFAPVGQIQGTVHLADDVLQQARQAALRQYEEAVQNEFCGESVETYALPDWLPPPKAWIPLQELHAAGLEPDAQQQAEMVGTCDVDTHVDNIHGLVLVVVLHNDGLKFHQGRYRHVTKPGQWFIFDDRLPHQVTSTPASTCYLCIVVPLKPRES